MNISGKLVILSALGLLVSFWNRNDLPGNIELLPELNAAPKQSAGQKDAFTANWLGRSYEIKPLYDYDLTGMIVSFRHHDGDSFMHRQSDDHLNMLDICVVWGETANNPFLDQFSFWNGTFTCNFSTSDQQAWAGFDIFQISNNHLLSDNERIRKQVEDIRVGDQIRVQGWLSSYTGPSGSERGTSTTRRDSGNGACETIFVNEFDILRPALSYWRMSMYGCLVMLLLSLAAYFSAPHRPYRG